MTQVTSDIVMSVIFRPRIPLFEIFMDDRISPPQSFQYVHIRTNSCEVLNFRKALDEKKKEQERAAQVQPLVGTALRQRDHGYEML